MGVRYQVNETFFAAWSEEMAYVLGYLYADGSLEDSPSIRGKYMRVSSTDLDRVVLIRRLLSSEHTIVHLEKGGRRKPQYLLRIGSAQLYLSLCAFGLTPNKSLTMPFPNVPKKYLGAFTLGYFDGDGCAFIERNPKGKTRRLLAIFTSGSPGFLKTLHGHLVAAVGITGKGLCRHGSSSSTYQLRYSTRDSMRLYRLLYGQSKCKELALKRKYAIFTKYFEERRIGPEDFAYVLERKGPVAKG